MTVTDYYGRDGIVKVEINQVSSRYGEIRIDCSGLMYEETCLHEIKCKSPSFGNIFYKFIIQLLESFQFNFGG